MNAARSAALALIAAGSFAVAPPAAAEDAPAPIDPSLAPGRAPDAAGPASPGGGAAQDPISNPRGMVANFDVRNVVPILDELGLSHEIRTTEDGRSFLVASDGATLNFNIVPTACLSASANRCIGAIMVALFNGSANPQTVSAFNQRFVFSSGGVAPEGAFLLRYEIADYGIPRGNFASSLITFIATAEEFRKALASGSKTVRLEGYPSDLSARLLNLKSAEALGVARKTSADGPAAAHRLSIEAAPETVDALWRAGAPSNSVR